MKNKIKKLPIDLFFLAKLNGWLIISYKENYERFNLIDREILKDNWGITAYIKNIYIIFYDDKIPLTAQRFTIAHEIGHIVLGHFNEFNEFTKEKEANMFAVRILMPMCVLYECRVDSVEELEGMCCVSKESAQYRFNRLQLVKERQKFYTDRLEIKVKHRFAKFIKTHLKNKKNRN